jgi:anaerobic magnesium-protoporphyrin IX monomethyl ester cyclase
MPMKILLIQAWLGRSGDLPIYPLGLVYLATILEAKGHEITMLDPSTDHTPLETIARTVKRFAPDAIGVSFRNIDNQLRIDPFYYYKGFQMTIGSIQDAQREVRRAAPVIVGGPAFSMVPRPVMDQNPRIDLGLTLEAEASFPELLENLAHPARVKGVYYRDEKGALCYTGDREFPDFKDLPIPRRHFLDMAPYKKGSMESVGIQTKRGCALTCSYCVYPQLNGRNWRLRTPENVLEEIDYLRTHFGVRGIAFADSVVNLPYDYSTRIFELLKESGLKIAWMGYMHVRGVTREYLELCMASGCKSLIFSPDGLSRQALKGLRKRIKPEEIASLKRLIDKEPHFRHLKIEWTFFINPPGETLSGLIQTLWFFLSSKRFLRKGNRNCFINWIRMEPSSAVYQAALREGVISPETKLLPEDASLLSETFYSAPGLSRFDPLILAMLRASKYGRGLLAKRRSR